SPFVPPLFFLPLRRPPRSPPFPYTTLFRSLLRDVDDDLLVRLERLAVRALARDHARPRDRELVPLAAHRLHQDPQVQLAAPGDRSEEHTSELQSRENLVCRLLLEKKKNKQT